MVGTNAARRAQIRVCLVEKNPLAARELSRRLHLIPDIRIVSFRHCPAARSAYLSSSTVFVIDRGTLSEEWTRCAHRLRSFGSRARILVLDAAFSQGEMVELLAGGADGFLPY